jgi:hypothetical protein
LEAPQQNLDAMQASTIALLILLLKSLVYISEIQLCHSFDASSPVSTIDFIRKIGAGGTSFQYIAKENLKRLNYLKGGYESITDEKSSIGSVAGDIISNGLQSDNQQPLRIFCATWNVNGKPPLMPLKDWLITPAGGKEVDVYLIGFQEVQDLKLQGALLTDEDKGRQWARAALHAVGALPAGPMAPYRCVAARQMVGMSLVVLARAGLAVDKVAVSEAGTGFMNQGGNKGGVAARFSVGGLSFCCICSHLAASSDNVERRNQARAGENFQNTLSRARNEARVWRKRGQGG